MRTPVIFLPFLSLIYCCPAVVAQSSMVDSLTSVLATMEQDTSRVNTLISIGQVLRSHNLSMESRKELEQALSLSERLDYLRGKERALNALSQLALPHISTEERIQFHLERLKVCGQLNDFECTALSEGVLGLRYFSIGDYPRALKHYYMALRLNEQLRDTMDLAGVHYNLCTLYGRMDSTSQAMEHILEYMRLHTLRQDSISLVAGMSSLASIYGMTKEYDKALRLHSKVLRFYESRGDTSQMVFVLGNIGNVLRDQGEKEAALESFQRVVFLNKVKPDLHPMVMGQVLTQYGSLLLDMGRLKEAESTLVKALELSELVTSKRMIRDCLILLAQVDEVQGDHRSALAHYKLYMAYKDSLMNEETSLQLSNLRVIHDVEKKDAEIALLDAEKKAALAENEAKERKQQATVAIAAILLISAIGISLLVMRNRRQRHLMALGRAELQKSLLELEKDRVENNYLRSRLNTHFMKNALSSINGLISSGQHAKAQEYIGRFHELMKWTLENASSDMVSLSEELEMMRHYLTLEAPCAEDGLRWEVHIADDIDARDVELPPLILQPFVENALRHGLKGTGRMGEVRISVGREDADVVCAVVDNGRGMAPGDEAKPRSTGLRLVRERLEMFSRNTGMAAAMRMENTGSGTRAEVRLAA